MKKSCLAVCLVVVLALSVNGYAALLTHLEFEGNTTDSTGNIAYTATPGAYVPGPAGFGQAMQFQNALANVVYAEGVTAQLATVTTEITISMWAHGSDLLPYAAPASVIFSANDDQTHVAPQWSRISWQYPFDAANDYMFFDTWSDTGAFDRLYKYTGDTQFYKDGWHHIAVVKNTALGDTSPADARMKMYVDGNLWHDSTAYGYGGGDGTGSLVGLDNIYLGAEKQFWYFWDGLIDDFRIYDEELSQNEIQNIMIPEPATLSLLGLGALFFRRRK